MELFTQLFGDLLVFVYHCFDRIVIYGYLSGLSRPEQVVHFFRNVVGVAAVDKEILGTKPVVEALKRKRMAALASQRTRKIGRHRVRRGIRDRAQMRSG